ncbi:hypothetical protein, partial [uncultured Brachyspira sp.]
SQVKSSQVKSSQVKSSLILKKDFLHLPIFFYRLSLLSIWFENGVLVNFMEKRGYILLIDIGSDILFIPSSNKKNLEFV